MKTFKQFRTLNEATDPTDTIRKLLALADRPGTPEEGITARQQAERLALKHEINIAEVLPEPATKPVATPQPRQPWFQPFLGVLKQFGWRREWHPTGRVFFGCPHRESMRGHEIELTPDGKWSLMVHGNPRFGGNSPRDLFHHLSFYCN
jgi:hypothetical protein